MKQIPLTQNKHALVDNADFDFLNQWKWFATTDGFNFYAERNSPQENHKRKHIYMHRVIMNTPTGMVVDHIDGNGLNNQKNNLRNCNHAENLRNREKQKNNTSCAKGVHWKVQSSKYIIKSGEHRVSVCSRWIAQININGKRKHIGSFTDKSDAMLAYNEAAIKHYGDFAIVNIIPEKELTDEQIETSLNELS